MLIAADQEDYDSAVMFAREYRDIMSESWAVVPEGVDTVAGASAQITFRLDQALPQFIQRVRAGQVRRIDLIFRAIVEDT